MGNEIHDTAPQKGTLKSVVGRLALFDGLNEEDARTVADRCSTEIYSSGARLFESNEAADSMFIIVDGSVRIVLGNDDQLLGFVGPGETVGEISLLTGEPHSATACVEAPVMAAVMSRNDLDALIRERPDLGLVLYRNLAIGLGRKLRKTDFWLAGESA